MKKQYIAPTIEIFSVATEAVLAISSTLSSDEPTSPALAPEDRGSGRGQDWADFEAW